MISIKYKVLSPNARVPTKATPQSAAYDVYSSESAVIGNNETIPIHTGIIVQPQYGHYIHVFPRSGMAKNGISISNSPGVIDSDYAGELLVLLYNHSGQEYHVEVGHRIAQIMALQVNDLRFVESERLVDKHSNGFGSTGI